MNALEVSRELDMQFFTPSSIGAFGPSTPKHDTPQDTLQRPTTMYGVNKVAGELLCDYYFHRFGLDTRGVRFPGLISYVAHQEGERQIMRSIFIIKRWKKGNIHRISRKGRIWI